ncbi:hypothetical protein TorRG33x02_316490 [Trema orientale]|uniref:Uncharacterized protein n=1 Tax=Trema orientale TaxID=63057 RepID=A0A2P5BLN4_TREOI|nr:hypothetical protein TorRG33x02_316490 [Trema orientale]
MKEYGVSNSWIKQLTIDLDKYWKPLFLRKVPYPYCVLNFSNDGDVLIEFGGSYALWYDPMNNNISKLDGVDGFVPSFVESDFQIKGE